jgi:hypothetical protein
MQNNQTPFWEIHKPNFEFKRDLPVTQSAWSGHYYFAYDLISNIRPDIIVELGTHRGNSLLSMVQAAKDHSLETQLHGVDTWEGDIHAGYYGDDILNKLLNIKSEYYRDVNVNTHKMYFDEAVQSFQNNSIDVLHIDGLHTYEAVKHDFETWLPKVKKETGIIMFHDICVKRKGFGVHKFWNELRKRYNTIQFNHYHGLGVIILDEKLYNIFDKSLLRRSRVNYYSKSVFALIEFAWETLFGFLSR